MLESLETHILWTLGERSVAATHRDPWMVVKLLCPAFCPQERLAVASRIESKGGDKRIQKPRAFLGRVVSALAHL